VLVCLKANIGIKTDIYTQDCHYECVNVSL